MIMGFPGGSNGKESTCYAGSLGSIPGLGRFPGEGNNYPLQWSDLENSKDRGAWQVTVHGITNGWTWLRNFHFQDDNKALFFINMKKVPLHKSIWRYLLLNFQNMVKFVHFLQTYESTYMIMWNHFLLNHQLMPLDMFYKLFWEQTSR